MLVLAASCAGPRNPSLASLAPIINETWSQDTLVLVPGDVVEVRFPTRPEWTHSSEVQHDGTASFLFIEPMRVDGKSLRQLQTTLIEAYGKRPDLIDDVRLSVALTSEAPRTVAIMGEVNNPGSVEVEGGHLTLLEALALAGGYEKGGALLRDTMLIRWLPELQEQRVWRIDARRKHWHDGAAIKLQAHDVVYVPNNRIDRVNVWVDRYIRRNIPIGGFGAGL